MYKKIAQWISNNKRGFRKRFRILLGVFFGIWIIWVIASETFPEERAKILPLLKNYRYIISFGIVWAMGWMIYRDKKNR